MIHAKDLMVGDWVKWCHQPYRVFGIVRDDYGEMRVVIRGWYGYQSKADELYPIPITPEILEKNGFKEEQLPIGIRKMIWESEDTRTEIVLYMDDTMPMEIRKNIYYEDEICYTLPFVWAVHQLQHALRLCGIEKEIEL